MPGWNLPKFRGNWVAGGGFALLVALGIMAAGLLSPFRVLELRTLDMFFGWRGAVEPSGSVVIIAIDDSSIDKIREPYAFYNRHIAKAAGIAVKGGAVAVGLDVLQPRDYVNREFVEGNKKLGQLLERSPNVVGTYRLYPSLQAPTFLQSLENAGAAHLTTDEDGVVRNQVLVFEHPRGVLRPSFSLQVFRAASGEEETTESILPGEKSLIDYAGPTGTFPRFSLAEVLEGKVPQRNFKRKVVLIGDVSRESQEFHMTPFSDGMPGVEIHANVLHTLLTGRRLDYAPPLLSAALLLALAVIAGVAFSFLGAGAGLLVVILMGGVYVAAAYGVFFHTGFKLELVRPLLALATVYTVVYGRGFSAERKRRLRLQRVFSQHVDPGVVREIVSRGKGPKLEGETRILTVLFSDIENFTTISEKLPPEQLLNILNEYFSAMAGIVFKEKGTLGKFMGDGLMAYWGAPGIQKDHAERAVRAATVMCEWVSEIAGKWKDILPVPFRVRIGIHTGSVIVGEVGSNVHREYTVLGDNVNIAARLEQLNKTFGSRIIISSATHDKVKDKTFCKALSSLLIKGKTIPVEVYELKGWKA